MQLTTRTAFSAAQGAGRSVQCRVVRAEGAARSSTSSSSSDASRRQALSFGLLAGGAALLLPANQAWALIPDEEDEEMLEKAKANRQKRLAAQKETTRDFLREEGLKDKQLDSELIPVQKAVLQLAKSGSQLEAGDVRGAASTLSGRWVDDLTRATSVLDATDAESDSARALIDGLGSLRAAANKGDLKASKQQFVAVVGAVQDWAKATGLAPELKGL